MSGAILGFSIWSLVALVMLVIAIVDLRSEKPVGFYTGVKPPEVTDVKNITERSALSGLFISESLNSWACRFYSMSKTARYLSSRFWELYSCP